MHRFEKRGYQLLAAQLMQPSKELLTEHYRDLTTKPFFADMVEFMSSGPVLAMVFRGRDAVKTGRRMLGETNPLASQAGTVRGDYAIDVGRNVCHGSDSVESAEREIALWFPQGVCSYSKVINQWICE